MKCSCELILFLVSIPILCVTILLLIGMNFIYERDESDTLVGLYLVFFLVLFATSTVLFLWMLCLCTPITYKQLREKVVNIIKE